MATSEYPTFCIFAGLFSARCRTETHLFVAVLQLEMTVLLYCINVMIACRALMTSQTRSQHLLQCRSYYLLTYKVVVSEAVAP